MSRRPAALEGFERTDPSAVTYRGGRYSRCSSRTLLEAFIESDEECLSKPMRPDELSRVAYNLRQYRRKHVDAYGNVGISARDGRLILYRLDRPGE